MSSERKPSIFAQRMQEKKKKSTLYSNELSSISSFGNKSYIVKGADAEIIHNENINKLSAMSESEILQEQRELLQTMKSANIEFLKKRRKMESNTNLNSSFSTLSTQESSSNTNLELINKGLHMDVIESEKLKWMEDVPIIIQPLPNSLYNARFDFEGNLLPYIEENKPTINKGLYHHGEEPQRPGYTIEELYQLSRSSLIAQRIMALNTLASILEKEVMLSNCLETELLKAVLDSGVFLILRFSLDEPLRTVYLAALRALGFLFWRTLDMHYLSDMVGIFGDLRLPSFEVNSKILNLNETYEIQDVELIRQDVVKGALRTDIVQRFRYIIDDPCLEIDHILSITKCLIRFCFHSYEATAVIMRTPLFMEILFRYYVSSVKSPKRYFAKLIFLCRVIVCRSEKFALDLANRLQIVPFLLEVLSNPTTKVSVSNECIYLWYVLLYRGIELNSLNEFCPMLYPLLNPLLTVRAETLEISLISNTTAWITLLIFTLKNIYGTVKFLIPEIEGMCCHWINMISNGKEFSRELTKLVANTIFLLTELPQIDVSMFHIQINVFSNSVAFVKMTEELKKCSFLLHASRKNFVNSLPSLCIPLSIQNTKNSFLIVHSILKYYLQHGDRLSAKNFLNNHVWTYIITVLGHSKLTEIANLWCARYEISFLFDVVKLCIKWNIYIEKKLLQLAFALVRIIHTDDSDFIKELFSRVIFNFKVYEQIIMDNCHVPIIFEDLKKAEQFFTKELNLPNTNFLLMSSNCGTEYILFTDWYYVPILKISNAKNTEVNLDKEIISLILRWIYLIEYISDDIKTDMSLAARFCRVSCVFFCGDVFLEVTEILYNILCEILKRNDKLEFKKPIPGISSFYDFYRELCEQFASASYCNTVFAMYVLVPLQQIHDCEFRKYVWTEQTVILQFLKLSANELPISFSCYLEPCETNLNLIETYLNMIATGRVKENVSPVMYQIGLHHVATFVHEFKDEMVAQRLKQKIENIGNKELRNKFLSYIYLHSQ